MTTVHNGFGHERAGDGETNEWYTPKYITDALGPFDLDPCAAINRTHDIAKTNYTIVDDGFSKKWEGRTWMNPPYGRNTKFWLEKMSQHMNGIVLIFARTETKMFHQYVWPVASGIFFFEGRIKFIDEKGNADRGCASAPSCLISYDSNETNLCNHNLLKNSGLNGRFISLVI